MPSFARLSRDLFVLAHAGVCGRGAERGTRWERRVAEYAAASGIPVDVLPGGYTVFGHVALSGLPHQIDTSLGCNDALVICEWKAYGGDLPKNELLRFKAASDDYFMSVAEGRPTRPVMRIFGGVGIASEGVRRYAALHGIALIESGRWPAPVLGHSQLPLGVPLGDGPSVHDRTALLWLSRPLSCVLNRQSSGSFVIPRPASAAHVESCLSAQDRWSEWLWDAIDAVPGTFERILQKLPRREAA